MNWYSFIGALSAEGLDIQEANRMTQNEETIGRMNDDLVQIQYSLFEIADWYINGTLFVIQ